MRHIRIFAPATVANVACGFDIMGFALCEPGDEVLLRMTDRPGVVITKITGDQGKLPMKPEKNTVSVSVMSLLKHLKSNQGFEIELHKKMPLSSGLGSSAAGAVASVFGANILLGNPLDRKELLPFVLEGERMACGTGHGDNGAPSLLGGFVIIRSYTPLDIIKIPVPEKLYCTVIHPRIEICTEYARSILRENISLKDGIKQWGNVAGLVAGLCMSDYDLIGRSLEDVIAEPVRAKLIPGFYDVKNAALASGSLGASISGSGPSIFALSASEETARRAGLAMEKAFKGNKIESEIYISKINEEGPAILDGGI